MNNETPPPPLRIVVAFNACRRDLESLALAAGLAARRGGELQAVFVEELNLLKGAELPFTKEVDRIFGTERAFDPLRVSRAHRIGLSLIRQELDRLAERLQVHASVRTLRGHFVATALACVGEIDVLVIGRRQDHSGAERTAGRFPASTLAGVTPGTGARQPVWAVFDGSAGALPVVAAAAELAAGEGRPLHVAVPRDPPGLAHALQGWQAAPEKSLPATIDAHEVHPFDPPTLLRRLRHGGCRMLVVDRAQRDLVEALAEAAEWPVVLV